VIVLGIESSCDETAAAVVRDGRIVLSSVIASQVSIHMDYGGVVPELAAREHIRAVAPVVRAALGQAHVDLLEIDAVAATCGPGLVGALLVGFAFAKALAYGLGKPLVGVDHLEAHIESILISPDPPPFPFVALLVSGGHTSLFHVADHGRLRVLGRTRDDAAGEAFDKVAAMLGLDYPGGAAIERLASEGRPGRLRLPRPLLDNDRLDFSFSGLKSAVARHLESAAPNAPAVGAADIAAEFQAAVADILALKAVRAAAAHGCRHVALVGGVAANQSVRRRLQQQAAARGIRLHAPPLSLCGDNAAMVAAAGWHQLQAGGGRCDLDSDVYSRVPPHPATDSRPGPTPP
jgi:N6-L-threonylcarbamoyladenine synthase